jgi:glutamine amidotransferase
MNVTIFDYGAGNMHSLAKALEVGGAVVRLERDPATAICDTDALVLPGVGAFTPATECLAPGRGAVRAAIAAGLPCLGVCLGMQLLFECSEEGPGAGLGVFAGDVSRLTTRTVPHIGWNAIVRGDRADDLVFCAEGYYANSFVCNPSDAGIVTAWSEHEGVRFPAAVRSGRVVGAQFHPEKSSAGGIRFLRAFLDEVRALRTRDERAPV